MSRTTTTHKAAVKPAALRKESYTVQVWRSPINRRLWLADVKFNDQAINDALLNETSPSASDAVDRVRDVLERHQYKLRHDRKKGLA